MMKLFRNPEVKRTLLLQIIFSLAAAVTTFVWEKRFGMFTLGVCAAFILIYLLTTCRRYRRIAQLAGDIDRLLHGDSQVALEKYAEGELNILQSEVYKMTVRLREQQQSLQDDKVYLADSLADISHQMRTPLTSINLLVSFLSEPDITEERRQKLSHELYELLGRIDWLIATLLKISRLDAGTARLKQEHIPLEELIQKGTAPLLVPLELRNQTLKVSAEGMFFGDVSWTCEAIANIVKNCMEHTPEGGTIEVDAAENALYTEIIISDNGNGIQKEDLPHIFERFYKGKDSGDRSFGIGLALARKIITAQNGTVKAGNRMPKGARFTLRFYRGTV
ncbi:MAG: HAMP domain-containing histidine kinase [Firmicutes bacterium]|nr:HAMP domain-containing histidine kinase [Bacillota bacterium]